ncbi:MAG: hypothetical protein JWO67_2218 [Streptosporangiaceae bacterium]|nr:hypothetical protein [Streptosporangiaceae bacterium]
MTSFENEIPDLRPAFERRVPVGSGVAALFTDEPKTGASRIAIEHQCTRPRDGMTLLIAPFLTADRDGRRGHQLLSEDPLTVTPSILCADCGLHGFITDGTWRSV